MMRKKTLLLLFITLCLTIFYGLKLNMADKKVQLNYESLKEKAQLLSNEWKNPTWGREELEQNCPVLAEQMQKVDLKFLRCNPLYLKCRFKNKNSNWYFDFHSEAFPHLGYLLLFISWKNILLFGILSEQMNKWRIT